MSDRHNRSRTKKSPGEPGLFVGRDRRAVPDQFDQNFLSYETDRRTERGGV